MAIAASALAATATPALGATITVNDTGVTAANDGVCVMREAITSANTNATSGALAGECAAGQALPTIDSIAFSLAGAGPHVISPTPPLPTITQAVAVDGSTEPDEVRLDGTAAGPVAIGLDVAGNDIAIEGITIANFDFGIDLSGSNGAEVRDNAIGTSPAGAAGLGNGDGIGAGFGAITVDAEISNNLISGNDANGIIFDGDALQNTITGNRIGTNPAGNAALANGQSGIAIFDGADGNAIGGPGVLDGNIISGNGGSGVRFLNTTSDRATGNTIEGNRIGTRIGGENALANGSDGIAISGGVDGTEVRGNLISANAGRGVFVEGYGTQPVADAGPTATVVAGNLIGTDKDGEAALGNENVGVGLYGTNRPVADTVIGGTVGLTPGGACSGDCNVISATGLPGDASGITMDNATDTQVLGNHVGTDLAGAADLGNAGFGVVSFDSAGSVIGAPGGGNVISGNGSKGVLVTGAASTGNLIQANLVGVGSDGTTDLGNFTEGVAIELDATENLVGGTEVGAGNVIANSGQEGVGVSFDATDNAILGNEIKDNDQLGIDLNSDGVTANDQGDADTGENDLQNYPELLAAVAGSSTVVAGQLDSTPDTSFRIEVFANPTGDSSGNGEGAEFLGVFDVTTDEFGYVPFVQTLAGTAGAGDQVSATATELSGSGDPLSTSEFSANVTEGCDITGTSGDDPAIVGTGASEVICGLGGDDSIAPQGGEDVVIGGPGTDEVDYSTWPSAIEANLATGTIGGAGADLVEDVEDVIGSDFDDIILGDDGENFVQANAGKDTVEGGDGADRLKGGDGGDTIKGNDGSDELLSQDGGDTLRGQDGNNDDLSAGPGKDSLNGGGGNSDHCNGGGNDDDTSAPGCESTSSIP